MLFRERVPYQAAIDRAPKAGPDGAKVLVFLVINIEEWQEERPMPRQVLSAPTGIAVMPDLPNWAWHEYGMRVGFWRMLAALQKRGIKPTATINARVMEAYPRVAAAMRDEDWEFMGHGLYQIPTHKVEDPATMIARAVKILTDFTGRPTAGWLGPGLTQTYDTTDLLAANGIRYCGDYILDDVPVEIATTTGRMHSMPYSAELNDIPMIAIQQHPGRELIERTTAQLDRLLLEGEADGGCRVMGIGLHPYICGVPHRIGFFEQILDLVQSRPGAAFAQGSQILDWWTTA